MNLDVKWIYRDFLWYHSRLEYKHGFRYLVANLRNGWENVRYLVPPHSFYDTYGVWS